MADFASQQRALMLPVRLLPLFTSFQRPALTGCFAWNPGVSSFTTREKLGLVFKSRQSGRQSPGSFLARTLVAGAFEDQRQGTPLLPFASNFRASGIELSLVAGG